MGDDVSEELELEGSPEQIAYEDFTREFEKYAKKWGELMPKHLFLPLPQAERTAGLCNDADVPRLFRIVSSHSAVVDLTHGCIGKAGCHMLARYCGAEGASTVTELRLDYNQMGEQGLEVLSDGLAPMQVLHTISLDCNSIGPRGVSALSKRFLSTSITLRAVLLNNNSIGDEGVETVCSSLSRSDTKLDSLHMQQVGLTAKGCGAVRALLLKCQTLQTLLLSRNPGIGDEGAALLAQGLAKSSLQHCSLADIGISDRGAKDIAGVFAQGCRIHEMIVGPNEFGDQGAMHFADALEASQTVREVVMPRSGITVAGMRCLCFALLRNEGHKVDIVHVEDNPGSMEEEAVELWKQCLRPNLVIHLSSLPKSSKASKTLSALKGKSKHSPTQHARALREREQLYGREGLPLQRAATEKIAPASEPSSSAPLVLSTSPTKLTRSLSDQPQAQVEEEAAPPRPPEAATPAAPAPKPDGGCKCNVQ
eukprot:Hpha_TRINITY_DN16963_c3_g2::TRINITY_DN16963_c3_g2_i1::g.55580::m.55580